jgi:hypothetical protein
MQVEVPMEMAEEEKSAGLTLSITTDPIPFFIGSWQRIDSISSFRFKV